jgi:2-polyprenyl-6-methoxyphenol hydroxylase-like FAD-dependent oxidoreductase
VTISDILVVGGGFAGLSAAAALGAAGAKVTVLEAHQGSMAAFRGELLHSRGVRTLAEIGLGDTVSAGVGVNIYGFAAFEGPEHDAMVLPYAAGTVPGFGFEHLRLIAHLRREVARRMHVHIELGARVAELISEHGRPVGVRGTDGREHRAPLLVAADGRHSRVRKLLGIPADTSLLSQMMVVDLEGDLLPKAGFGHVFLGAPGPVLAYPYAPGKVRMCIDVPLGVPAGRNGLAAYVRDHHLHSIPEPLREALSAALDRGRFSGAANHAIYTSTCVAPGVALVGDAGGCSHPLTATGMTSALNDVSVLAQCLSRSTDVDDALEEYQRRRYPFVRAREVLAHAMYEVFREAGSGALAMRAGMFRYWRATERAREGSMRILSGDDDRVASFLGEYARVMGRSLVHAWGVAEGGARFGQMGRTLTASMEGLRPLLRVVRLPGRGQPSLRGVANGGSGEGRAEHADHAAPDRGLVVQGGDSVQDGRANDGP